MVREVSVKLPRIAGQSGGSAKAIAFQDLPSRAVATYQMVSPEMKGAVSITLLGMALGDGVDLEIYSFAEIADLVDEWQDASLELGGASENEDAEVDWSELL